MNRKTRIALVGAVVLALSATGVALAAGSGPAVSVKVKTLSKTLLHATGVHGEKRSITKGKTPRGKCPGSSAAGALDAATHGHWTAKYFASLHDVFITSILGVKPKRHEFWGIYVNGKAASVGACEIKLHPGEKLLFKITK
jgi:uncharacterized low-complexity protein